MVVFLRLFSATWDVKPFLDEMSVLDTHFMWRKHPGKNNKKLLTSSLKQLLK